MMKYACLVYQDATNLAGLSEAEQLSAIVADCQAAGDWVAELRKGDHHVFSAGLQSVNTAKTVRRSDGKLSTTDGPFAETKECLGGFTIIEARDFSEALQLVARFVSKLLTIEVRPLLDANAELTDSFDQKIAKALRRQTNLETSKPPEIVR